MPYCIFVFLPFQILVEQKFFHSRLSFCCWHFLWFEERLVFSSFTCPNPLEYKCRVKPTSKPRKKGDEKKLDIMGKIWDRRKGNIVVKFPHIIWNIKSIDYLKLKLSQKFHQSMFWTCKQTAVKLTVTCQTKLLISISCGDTTYQLIKYLLFLFK